MTTGKDSKNKIKTNNAGGAAKSFSSTNDMEESFFSYLADLKNLDVPSDSDKDELIWQVDSSMYSLSSKIFSFAPAVENFCQILEELTLDSKNKEDIFFASSLREHAKELDTDYFRNILDSLRQSLEKLSKNYQTSDGAELRRQIINDCCKLKVNYDYLELFFNRICDYLTLWSEKDSLKIRDHQKLTSSYNAEQRSFLAEKFMLPDDMLNSSMNELFEINQQLIALKHEILRHHLRLVINIAQKFRNRGISFNDIVQEGNLGLMRAIDKFDPHLGHKFSTYAVWWIKQNIIHGIAEQSRTIRIPAHMLTLISKINKTEQHLLQTLGREPESEEIAAILQLPVAKINAVRCMARQAISLQSPVGSQDDSFSLEDVLKDNTDSKDFTDFDKDVTYQMLYKMLKTLSPREQEIIVLRFGLFGNKPTPFTELSERYNLTRERVRQLELKILNKLRAPDKLKLLDHYISPKNK